MAASFPEVRMPVRHQLLLRALILLGLIVFGVFLTADAGLLTLALDSDRSYISWVILGAYAVLTLQWLYLVYELSIAQADLTASKARLSAAGAGDLALRGGRVFVGEFAVPPGYFADVLSDLLRKQGNQGDRGSQVLLDALGERLVSRHAFGHFAADGLLKLGLLGTIIGFIMMLMPVGELQDFDPNVLQKMLGEMSGGMAVALFTTIAGLVTSTLLALQYEVLGNSAVRFVADIARTVEVDVVPTLYAAPSGAEA